MRLLAATGHAKKRREEETQKERRQREDACPLALCSQARPQTRLQVYLKGRAPFLPRTQCLGRLYYAFRDEPGLLDCLGFRPRSDCNKAFLNNILQKNSVIQCKEGTAELTGCEGACGCLGVRWIIMMPPPLIRLLRS